VGPAQMVHVGSHVAIGIRVRAHVLRRCPGLYAGLARTLSLVPACLLSSRPRTSSRQPAAINLILGHTRHRCCCLAAATNGPKLLVGIHIHIHIHTPKLLVGRVARLACACLHLTAPDSA
jgi:hypothetical protein